MPASTSPTLPAGQWTLIASNCTILRADPKGGAVELQATVGAVSPGAVSPGSQTIDSAHVMKLSEVFAGVAGATHVYGRPTHGSIIVDVSHD